MLYGRKFSLVMDYKLLITIVRPESHMPTEGCQILEDIKHLMIYILNSFQSYTIIM